MPLGPSGSNKAIDGFNAGVKYAALFKTDGNEVSGGGYSRVSSAFTQGSGNDANRCSNNAALDFGQATANWGSINEVRLYTTASTTSESNREFTAGITARAVNANDTFSIPAQGFEITWT